MEYYPIALRLKNKPVTVVGAGKIARRKIKTLLGFGAHVKVIAPKVMPYISALSGKGKISLLKKRYRTLDIKGASLVIAATSDRVINARVSRDCREKGILVNVVDDSRSCEFISPAIIKKAGLVIAISSDAKNPRRTKAFKDFLKRKLDEFNFSRHQL